MNDSIHHIHNVYSQSPFRSEIWDSARCQRREISPIRTATHVSLSSLLHTLPPAITLLRSLSLFLDSFLLRSHTEARRLERLRAYVRSGRDSLKESMCFWKSLGRFRPLHGLSRSSSLSRHPPATRLMYPFYSLTSSQSMSLSTPFFLSFRQTYAYA